MFKDCQGIPYPVYAEGCVSTCKVVKDAVPANSVYELVVLLGSDAQEPAAGQFYMLHAVRSNVLLGRPISVYKAEKNSDGKVEITFLILLKGRGTEELCSLTMRNLPSSPVRFA